MPQVTVSSSNINVFSFTAKWDLLNKQILLDTSSTTYFGSGINLVQGISFAIVDGDGVTLATLDFTNASNYIVPSVTQTKTIDLSSLSLGFLFQTYSIVGAIKDQNSTVYSTTVVYKKVCQPVGINDSNYVPGVFQFTADCVNNNIVVKELTLLVYNNQTPSSVTKTGTLYYPTGTVASVPFSNTPFTNNVVYTGQYRITCSTVGEYDLGDGVFVDVTYFTDSVFNVTCADKMADLLCCIQKVQSDAINQCNNAIGKNAQLLLDNISPYLLTGLLKEINGQDASIEAEYIKKKLGCNCGATSVGQNEITPINPSVYNIVIAPAGDVYVSAVTTGSTKTFTIGSKTYQVAKGNTGDLAFTITTDTSVSNVVKYLITFNYDTVAQSVLNAIAANPTELAQLQAMVNSVGVDLTGLNGKCIIDLTKSDYFLTQVAANTGWTIKNIVINGVIYVAPGGLLVNNTVSVNTWLNSITLGMFLYSMSGLNISVQSLQNTNVISTMSFQSTSPTTGVVTTAFTRVNKTLVQVLQAIINYLCGITALQVALGDTLQLNYFDYNGNIQTLNFGISQSQDAFNQGLQQTINSLVSRMNTITGLTCQKLAAIFLDNAVSSFTGNARLYGNDGASCVGFTNKQIALGVISAINSFSDVKTAFCAIDCTVPGSCPDVAANNISVVSGNIAIYGVTWTQNPSASQTVTVKYRVHGTTSWTVSINGLVLLANGNVSSNPPYLITGLSAGQSYDVSIQNNCGGNGFISVVTVPTGTVYTGSFLLNNVLYNVCGSSPQTLYSSSPFGTGVIMYTDIGLTTPRTGFIYITAATGGDIFNINTSTGLVGATTGNSCTSGTAGSYLLGNNSGTICATSPITLYTSGPFTIGGTIYTDSGLTHPVTGNSFVVNLANNHIYNLNSSTGAIGSDTGLSCSNAHGVINVGSCPGSPSITNVVFNGTPVVLNAGSFPVTAGTIIGCTCPNPGVAGILQVTVANVTGSASLSVQDSNSSVACQNAPGSTTVTFFNYTIDSRGFDVVINCTPC